MELKIDRGLCGCAAAALTCHTALWCQKLLSYICVTVSTGSSLHQFAVMSSAGKGFFFSPHFYSFTAEQLQHINPGFQYDLTHTLTDGNPLGKPQTCFCSLWSEQCNHSTAAAEITSVSPPQSQHYCRKAAIIKTWRREQISAEVVAVLQAPDHSRGFGSVKPWHRGRRSRT